MEAKYHMTREQSVFVAKRNIVDYIWKSAHLEGLAVTYPETDAIFNGMGVTGVKVSDIIVVNNLKHAWQFLLDNLDYPIDFRFICQLHKLVGKETAVLNAGYLRTVDVSIGGTTWRPGIPDEEQVKEDLQKLLENPDPTDRALELMLYLVRKQLFYDGNKRVSMLAANHVMVANGCGVISIPIERQVPFMGLLVRYYETGDAGEIKQYLYDFCIDGIQFEG